MTDLRQAAQQALEALGLWATGRDMDAVALNDLILRLEAALENQFNPDWDRTEALQESLREHMAEIHRLRAALAEPVQEPVQEHENWCASVTQLLLCDPPRKAPCNCKKKVAEPVQEPVAWVECDGDLVWNNRDAAIGRNLYTAPPQRKPLTDDQLDDIVVAARRGNLYDLRIAIERAHGIGGSDD